MLFSFYLYSTSTDHVNLYQLRICMEHKTSRASPATLHFTSAQVFLSSKHNKIVFCCLLPLLLFTVNASGPTFLRKNVILRHIYWVLLLLLTEMLFVFICSNNKMVYTLQECFCSVLEQCLNEDDCAAFHVVPSSELLAS